MTIWAKLGRSPEPLMLLPDALAALGRDGSMGSYDAEVPLATVVGSATRRDDFDAEFRLVNSSLKDRHRRVREAFDRGGLPPPLELVRLGELHFVRDGHHRVSVARSLGWDHLPARVTRICTVAYAMACLRAQHLDSKAAERRFLERIPLPEDVRRDLWLDSAADWARLADSAQAWGYRQEAAGDAHALAAAWWEGEVLPLLERLRAEGLGLSLRDVQLYQTALALRDQLGALDWPPDLIELLRAGGSCCTLGDLTP